MIVPSMDLLKAEANTSDVAPLTDTATDSAPIDYTSIQDPNSSPSLDEAVESSLQPSSVDPINPSYVGPYVNDPGGGGTDGYTYLTQWKGNKPLDSTSVTAIAGILASIYGGAITGVITTLAGTYYSYKTPFSWYKVYRYSKYDGNRCYIKDVTWYYRDQDYYKYVGSASHIWMPSRCY